jgi:hypothetical protein
MLAAHFAIIGQSVAETHVSSGAAIPHLPYRFAEQSVATLSACRPAIAHRQDDRETDRAEHPQKNPVELRCSFLPERANQKYRDDHRGHRIDAQNEEAIRVLPTTVSLQSHNQQPNRNGRRVERNQNQRDRRRSPENIYVLARIHATDLTPPTGPTIAPSAINSSSFPLRSNDRANKRTPATPVERKRKPAAPMPDGNLWLECKTPHQRTAGPSPPPGAAILTNYSRPDR